MNYRSDWLHENIIEGLWKVGVLKESEFMSIIAHLKAEEEKSNEERKNRDIQYHKSILKELDTA